MSHSQPLFFRNQNPHERVGRLNQVAVRLALAEDRIEAVEDVAGTGSGPASDPGDLTVYYENGKA